jgi:glycosyltransferase involved in cell wall biosynthesis
MEAYPAALDQIEDVLVQYGSNTQLLEAAKAVRINVGPLSIEQDKRHSLSLCMIVKNEEKYLARCLASVKPMVDEIIIVDTGSTDATREIAEVFGARVFVYEWNDDFSAARNHSLEKASGDWILIMDADEIIADKDHKGIRKLLSSKSKKQCACMVLTRNYTNQYNIIGWEQNKRQYPDAEAGTGWIPSEKVRLFPNNKDIRFEYPVHELVSPSLKRMNIPVVSCPYPVHHYGKLDLKKEVEKDLHYYTLGMKKLELVKDDPAPIREMAIQAHKLGKTEESIALWQKYIKLEPKDANSFVNISTSYMKLKQYADAREAAQMAVKLSPSLKTGHLNLGLSELLLGNVKKAEKIFHRIAKKHHDYFSAIFLLASSQLCQEKNDAAAKTLRPLEGSAVWTKISYATLNLLESLSEAGQIDLMRNLIAGSIALECSNKEILEYRHRLRKEAA